MGKVIFSRKVLLRPITEKRTLQYHEVVIIRNYKVYLVFIYFVFFIYSYSEFQENTVWEDAAIRIEARFCATAAQMYDYAVHKLNRIREALKV